MVPDTALGTLDISVKKVNKDHCIMEFTFQIWDKNNKEEM